jgi:hypothetical protein
VKKLVESIENRVADLKLNAEIQREKEYLTEITVYATALAMNYVARGKFVPEGRLQVTGNSEQKRGTKKGNRLQTVVQPPAEDAL